MSTIRFNGTAEQMGNVAPLSSAEIPEEFTAGERGIARLLASVPLGSVALLDAEFTLPNVPPSAKPHRASFIDSAELGYGRDEARHQPKFGQMILNGVGLHERPILIAAKPFHGGEDEHPNGLLHREWAASNYLNSLSDRELAYIPLGVWRTAEGVNHLLSLYEHDVKSYDNVFWADKSLVPEALRPANIEYALIDCLRGLGYLHGAGLVHTDAEAKNMAADFSGIRFIDLEGIQQLPRKGTQVENSDTTINLVRHDIETFFDSTIQVDENRVDIAPILAKTTVIKRLAQVYRAGLRLGKKEAGLKISNLETSTDEYFKTTVNHTLAIARKEKHA